MSIARSSASSTIAARRSRPAQGIDWSTARGARVLLRCSATAIRCGSPGQDVERGTFSQRHSVLIDQEDETRYTPFNHIADKQARFEVINSMLSEEAVLGFEYGYSAVRTECADACGRRSSATSPTARRWCSTSSSRRASASGCACPASSACCRMATKGQGPEHSSARLERFLQMCAEDNMQVANCTTPANYFHILRRQLKREIRKPLILMTPKSLLRHKRAVSRLDEMGPDTSFHRAAVGRCAAAAGREDQARRRRQDPPRRAVLRQGLLRPLRGAREARHRRHLSAARRAALSVPDQGAGHRAFALQAMPRSCGARRSRATWARGSSSSRSSNGCSTSIKAKHRVPRYAGRPASAATAVGLMSKHLAQLKAFLDEALG